MAIFANNQDKIIPDPLVYRDWFTKAGEQRQRIAVGTRRYSAAKERTKGKPEWEDFLNPDTGDLLSIQDLKSESPQDRAERVQKVFDLLMQHRRHLARVGTFGFNGQPDLPGLGPSSVDVFRRKDRGPLVSG